MPGGVSGQLVGRVPGPVCAVGLPAPTVAGCVAPASRVISATASSGSEAPALSLPRRRRPFPTRPAAGHPGRPVGDARGASAIAQKGEPAGRNDHVKEGDQHHVVQQESILRMSCSIVTVAAFNEIVWPRIRNRLTTVRGTDFASSWAASEIHVRQQPTRADHDCRRDDQLIARADSDPRLAASTKMVRIDTIQIGSRRTGVARYFHTELLVTVGGPSGCSVRSNRGCCIPR